MNHKSSQLADTKKPRNLAATKNQGTSEYKSNSNNSNKELEQSKARYLRGIELYKEGKVSITKDGLYKVNGYLVDLSTPIECECPDFTNRHNACKHIYAAKMFDKERMKTLSEKNTNSENSPSNTHENQLEANSEAFSQERVNTRVALIGHVVELLKTHPNPVEFEEVLFLVSRLEKWALGK